jgi:hypothetical protein
LTDHLLVLEYVVRQKAARGRRLKRVFLLLDIDVMAVQPLTNRTMETFQHPDLTGEDPRRFWIRYLTAVQFRAWKQSVLSKSQPAPAAATVPPTAAASRNQPTRGVAAASSREHLTTNPYYQIHLANLRRFVAIARDQGIALTVALAPLSRPNVARFDPNEITIAVEAISRITPVWDFDAPQWLTDRTDLWHDLGHFEPTVGHLMLDRIFDGRSPPGVPPFGELRDNTAPTSRPRS